jgi:hypothetical protein
MFRKGGAASDAVPTQQEGEKFQKALADAKRRRKKKKGSRL